MSVDDVFEIARSGNGYLAIEKSSLIVRKMKKNNQLTEAMAFLMDLASVLAEGKQFASATNCALKSIEMFPISAKTIKIYLSNKFVDFIKSATPEYNYPDFYTYASTLIEIIGDDNCEIRLNVLRVAKATNNFPQIQYLLLQLIFMELKRECVQTMLLNSYLKELAETLWVWIFNVDLSSTEDRRYQRLYNAQFLFTRTIFALLASKESGITTAEQFIEYIKETAFSSILNDFYDEPHFHFVNFYIKALKAKSFNTVKFLEDKYQHLIVQDKELQKILDYIKEKYFPNTFNDGFGSILQSVMSVLGGNPN